MLTASQIVAILFVLQAFGVSQSTLALVQADLQPAATTTQSVAPVYPFNPAVNPSAAPLSGDVQIATTSLARIDVIDIGAAVDGQNAPHFAAPAGTPSWDAAPDGTFISVGAVVYDQNGYLSKNSQVSITASDSSQNAVLESATACDPTECYYPYHYLFRWDGGHFITFSANGTSTTINLMVASNSDYAQ